MIPGLTSKIGALGRAIRRRLSGRRLLAATVAALVASTAVATAVAQTQRFSDVPAGHPQYEAIEWAADAGLTTGYDDGTFRPTRALSKRHALVFMERFYDDLLEAEISDRFTRGDMMTVLHAVWFGIDPTPDPDPDPEPPPATGSGNIRTWQQWCEAQPDRSAGWPATWVYIDCEGLHSDMRVAVEHLDADPGCITRTYTARVDYINRTIASIDTNEQYTDWLHALDQYTWIVCSSVIDPLDGRLPSPEPVNHVGYRLSDRVNNREQCQAVVDAKGISPAWNGWDYDCKRSGPNIYSSSSELRYNSNPGRLEDLHDDCLAAGLFAWRYLHRSLQDDGGDARPSSTPPQFGDRWCYGLPVLAPLAPV